MTVYDILNIENCTVTERLSGRMYQITANTGWYIHLNDGDEEMANIWKTVVILYNDYDFSQVEIRAEADLPEGAEICGSDSRPEII